jgi:hypothetical protein
MPTIPPGITVINDKLTARLDILTTPFSGTHLLNYVVRPPVKPRPNEKLVVSYHFIVRTGVVVYVYDVNDGNGTVGISIVLIDSTYKPASLPTKMNRNIPLDDIKKYQNLKPLIEGLQALGGTVGGNPFISAVLQKGVDTDRFQFPTFTGTARYGFLYRR